MLLVVLVRRPHFIGNLGEEAPFYWVNVSPSITQVCATTLY